MKEQILFKSRFNVLNEMFYDTVCACVCIHMSVCVGGREEIDPPSTDPIPSKLSFPCTLPLAPLSPNSLLIHQGSGTLAVPRLQYPKRGLDVRLFDSTDI